MKWRRNYSNLSTEIIGVDTCQQWKQFLSKLKYLEIFLKFQIMQIPFSGMLQHLGFNCRVTSSMTRRGRDSGPLLPWPLPQLPGSRVSELRSGNWAGPSQVGTLAGQGRAEADVHEGHTDLRPKVTTRLCTPGMALGRADRELGARSPRAGLPQLNVPEGPRSPCSGAESNKLQLSQELRGRGRRPGPFPAEDPHEAGCRPWRGGQG